MLFKVVKDECCIQPWKKNFSSKSLKAPNNHDIHASDECFI